MPLVLRDCTFAGPALPEPFVKFELERQLAKLSPLPKETGPESRTLQEQWETYRRKLRALGESGGDLRVLGHVVEPLAALLGYGAPAREERVKTREGEEDAGWWMPTADGSGGLRAWTVALGTDLDAPNRRGRAYRFSPARVAGRVLLAKGERAALLTDGVELRLLLCDPARPDSHIAIALDRTSGWRGARNTPDSLRLILALARPKGVAALPEIIEAARLSQTTVTRKLREQARNAVRDFVQCILDEPANVHELGTPNLSKVLWEEGLIIVYRLLFVLKMESSADPSRAFSFAATSLWRNSYSPNTALAPAVTTALKGVDTGGFLEFSLRTLFRLFAEGMESVELKVSPLGGALFGPRTTPTLDSLHWGERAVAFLLDALLWTPGEKKTERERVHYGSLDVEDLGRVYEALLELEPGITSEPMCRLRRAKLEVVVPAAQGAPYRANAAIDVGDEEEGEDDEEEKKGKGKTKVAWVEDIPAGRFFLRTGLGRKSSGSYYTPHPFVRFLVQETLGPQVAERSPQGDPRPLRILELKVLDPAMGSGHFLVEACRFLGDALYEACRLCDERASTAEEAGRKEEATELRKRVEDLPDPNNELLDWLPSKAPEGTAGGLSQQRAQSLCRRLVAVHCLYGVDKNRLAVELAKLSLWLESYAEGLPLTFMDHRLVCGDSLTGPFLEHLFTWPKVGGPIGDDLLTQGLRQRLGTALAGALQGVHDLTASVGKDVADLERKATAKARLDEALSPFRMLAAAWAGAVMLGDEGDDGAYLRAVKAVAAGEALPDDAGLARMVEVGGGGVVYDLAFPEVFHPDGGVERTGGFDAVVGNPPWDKLRVEVRDFVAGLDPKFLVGKEAAGVGGEHVEIERVFGSSAVAVQYRMDVAHIKRSALKLASRDSATSQAARSTSDPDLYRLFLLRTDEWSRPGGLSGFVVGGGLAKIPSDAPLRRWLFETQTVSYFLHFVNLRQLFGGASSRISFLCILHARAVPRLETVQLGMGLESFLDLPPTGGRLQTVARSKIDATLLDEADFTRLASDSGFTGPEVETDALTGLASLLISPAADLHRTNDKEALQLLVGSAHADARHPANLVALSARGLAPLYGGRSMTNHDSYPTAKSGKWEPAVDEVVDLRHPLVSGLLGRTRHFRFAWRATCGHVSTNERSARACLLPAGAAAGDSLRAEASPEGRPNANALLASAVFNSFTFDHQARRVVQSNLNLGVLKVLAWPSRIGGRLSLAHAVLRLECVHPGYAPLWTEQLGDAWREPTPKHTWPVLVGDDARWAVRAAIDAVVADAYGLSREQYSHILGSFSHKSYPKAPVLCLAAFDELKSIGLDAFAKRHDPYHDIPLNEALPKPVIDDQPTPVSPAPGSLFGGG